MYDFLTEDFYRLMAEVDFNALGIVDAHDHIHTLGTDSKIIGRVFEMFTQPILQKIAKSHRLTLTTPELQTHYPDFIMMENRESTCKIAIDVKSTYIDTTNATIKFTLGSFASYMRNNTKNIEYRYTDYVKHYVIGFVYRRNTQAQESLVYDYSLRHQIVSPYHDVRFFIQEKYKIAGDRPGSGNTENIGSISSSDFDDFKFGKGPFSILGQDAFDLYWKYYPKYRSQTKTYSSLDEFLIWLPQHIQEVELFHPLNRDELLKRLNNYQQNKQTSVKE